MQFSGTSKLQEGIQDLFQIATFALQVANSSQHSPCSLRIVAFKFFGQKFQIHPYGRQWIPNLMRESTGQRCQLGILRLKSFVFLLCVGNFHQDDPVRLSSRCIFTADPFCRKGLSPQGEAVRLTTNQGGR
jgi:hypothetical protein